MGSLGIAVVLGLGVVSILVMGRVYRLKTVPVWNSISVPIDFIGTALIVGPVLFAILNLLVYETIQETSGLIYSIISFTGLCFKVTAISITIKTRRLSQNQFWYATSEVDKLVTEQ